MTKWLNLDFPDNFTVSKIDLIFLKMIFLQEYWITRTTFTVDFFFDNFNFCQLGIPTFQKTSKSFNPGYF